MVLLLTLIIISLIKSSASPVASSFLIEVPYHDQQTNYYCGPASIQMVLEYSDGLLLSQELLGTEVNADPIKGVTYTYAMDDPFRSYIGSKVSSGRTTLGQLKQRINQGYTPILLIWFDQNHETSHYVVALGYNETGIFINDPWPSKWGLPDGRDTGPYVYLSNEVLKDLWSSYYQWSMTVSMAQTAEKSFQIDVESNGLPDDVKTNLYLNGIQIKTLTGEDRTSLLLVDEPDYHILRVDMMAKDSSGVSYICEERRVLVGDSPLISFNYHPIK